MSTPMQRSSTAAASSSSAPYELAWYGCDLKSGDIIEDLRCLTPGGALSRRLGAVTTFSASLALDGAPADWEAATDPGRSLLVAVDTATDTPIWAGIPLTRSGGSGSVVELQAVTPEGYLDRRYTGTVTLSQTDQTAVCSALLGPALTDGPPFVLDAVNTGRVIDYAVEDGDDRTALSALQEVMGLEDGPEWTIDVTWSDASHSGFALPIRIRSAIGTQASQPEGTFDFPGAVSSYSLEESYESGKGATIVQARGEGEGSGRLSSNAYLADTLLANGWPRWVYRFTPATGLTDTTQLNAHAAKALTLMQTGAKVWNIEATASVAPRIGRDWNLGDNVRMVIDSSPRHSRSVDIIARAWSWELEPGADTVRPILVQED